MTKSPSDPAQSRFLILSAVRGVGTIIMLLGLVIGYGDVIRSGGHWPAGMIIFAVGLVVSFVLPRQLARRWRSPR